MWKKRAIDLDFTIHVKAKPYNMQIGPLLTEGGGGVQEPLILADVICEQPLKGVSNFRGGTHPDVVLAGLNQLRKENTFTDVRIQVVLQDWSYI